MNQTATPMVDAIETTEGGCDVVQVCDDYRTLARRLERDRAALQRDFDACYADFKEQSRLRSAREVDVAALIADLTAITDGLELHLKTPGAPLNGDKGTINFVTRARATLAQVRSTET